MSITNDDSDYQKTWESHWKEICTNPNGTLNLDAIQRELHDYNFLMENASAVYNHVTGGLLSKTNYYARSVISVYEEDLSKAVESEVADRIAELEKDKARLDWLAGEDARIVQFPHGCYFVYWGNTDEDGEWQIEKYPTPRAAIDAAMQSETEVGK